MKNADIILISHAIFDSVKDEPFDGAVAISDNKILYVGDKETAMRLADDKTVVKDFGDAMIMPGFFDGHGHYQTAAIREYGTCIKHLESCRSEQECVEGVVKYLKENPDCKRVHGRCFFVTSWGKDAPEPTKASLDAAVPDVPVYLLSQSGHAAWLNSAAIKESGIEEIVASHPEWPAEFARRDADGNLTGYLTENASYAVRWDVEVYDHDEIAEWDEKFMNFFTSLGITSFTDTNGLPARTQIDCIEPLKRLENEDKLTIRYHQWCGTNVIGENEDHASEKGLEDLKYIQTYCNTDKVRVAGAKFMLDGVPDTYTSAMVEPYAGRPSTKGDLLSNPEVFKKVIAYANEKGFSCKIHCLGSQAVKTAIDAYEYSRQVNGDLGRRNAVEHLDIIEEEDIKRMADLDIIASVQPAHLVDWFNGCGEKIYGPELYKREAAFHSLVEAGVRLSIGTDTPVVRVDPLRTVYAAVTRKNIEDGELKCCNPEQALTLTEVLKGYTIGSAYASHFDDKAGSLEVGKYADICVIDKNLFAIPAEEIKNCKNICTVFDGKIVYEA